MTTLPTPCDSPPPCRPIFQIAHWNVNRFAEIPGKPHWWDGVLRTKAIDTAIGELLDTEATPPAEFVLTVLWPGESGSLNGWKIVETDVAGR
jgi:hypothetical protein